MMMATLLYRAYMCTTVTGQAFNEARASRRTASRLVRRTSISRLCLGTLVPRQKGVATIADGVTDGWNVSVAEEQQYYLLLVFENG